MIEPDGKLRLPPVSFARQDVKSAYGLCSRVEQPVKQTRTGYVLDFKRPTVPARYEQSESACADSRPRPRYRPAPAFLALTLLPRSQDLALQTAQGELIVSIQYNHSPRWYRPTVHPYERPTSPLPRAGRLHVSRASALSVPSHHPGNQDAMATAEAGNSLPRPLEYDVAAALSPRAVDPLLSREAFSSPPTHTSRGPLHSGSTWVGVQRSGRNSYEVTVKFDE